jgi:hypothetical protein
MPLLIFYLSSIVRIASLCIITVIALSLLIALLRDSSILMTGINFLPSLSKSCSRSSDCKNTLPHISLPSVKWSMTLHLMKFIELLINYAASAISMALVNAFSLSFLPLPNQEEAIRVSSERPTMWSVI